MKNKVLIVLAPVKEAGKLKSALIMNYGGQYPFAFADSFAEAALKDSPTVIIISPTDLPIGVDDSIVVQTNDISDIGRATQKLLETGTDAEVSEFNRRMFRHQRLVSELTTGPVSARPGLNLTIMKTGVSEYDPLFKEHYQREFPFVEEPEPTSPEQIQDVELEQEISLQEAVSGIKPNEQSAENETLVETPPIAQPTAPVDNSVAEKATVEPEPITYADVETHVHLAGIEGSDTKMPENVQLPKAPEPSSPTANSENDDFDFDPLTTAFDNSVNVGLNAEETVKENKPEVTSAQQIYDRSLDAKEKMVFPEVNSTVEVNSKMLTDSKNPEAAHFSDWGGSGMTLSREMGRIDYNVEQAMNKKRRPSLSEFDQLVVRHADDSIANDELFKQQFIEGATWSGTVNTAAKRMPVISPIKNPDYGDTKYVGEEAVSLIQNRMKIGCKLGVYLPHTGIYFILNSPGDDAVLDTLSLINNYRVEALRESSGILLGNSNFYLYRQVLTLFMNNISGCSLANWNKETLISLIDERDMNIVSTALMASIYPDGYEYRQACGLVKDGKTCEHITSKLLDLRRLVFVDNSRLSEAQRNLALSALTQRSVNEINQYQQTNYIGFKKAYEITNGISFVYKAQTINTVIDAGEKWIKQIETAVDAIITFSEDSETRNAMIRQRIALARIREYSHWIVEIQVDGDVNVISDRSKIEELLKSLSRNQEVLDKVSETLSDFQRQSQIAIVAVPRVKCPVCQSTDQKDFDISPYLIPQDATARFFTLARQRLS